MAHHPTEARSRAESKFSKSKPMSQDTKDGWSVYRAQAKAQDEKSARLKVLRLAKEAADREEAAANPPSAKKAPAKRAAPRSKPDA